MYSMRQKAGEEPWNMVGTNYCAIVLCPDIHVHWRRMSASLTGHRDVSSEGVIESVDCANNAIIKMYMNIESMKS